MLKFTIDYPNEELQEVTNANALLEYYLNSDIKELFLDDFCKKAVKEIDKSDIISIRALNSPFLGSITPKHLSGDVSTLLVTYFLCTEGKYKFYIKSEFFGDNCVPLLMELATKFDIIVLITAPLNITADLFKKYPNIVYSIESETIINSIEQYKKTIDKYTEKFNNKYGEDEYDPELEKLIWKVDGQRTAKLLGMEWSEEDNKYD